MMVKEQRWKKIWRIRGKKAERQAGGSKANSDMYCADDFQPLCPARALSSRLGNPTGWFNI